MISCILEWILILSIRSSLDVAHAERDTLIISHPPLHDFAPPPGFPGLQWLHLVPLLAVPSLQVVPTFLLSPILQPLLPPILLLPLPRLLPPLWWHCQTGDPLRDDRPLSFPSLSFSTPPGNCLLTISSQVESCLLITSSSCAAAMDLHPSGAYFGHQSGAMREHPDFHLVPLVPGVYRQAVRITLGACWHTFDDFGGRWPHQFHLPVGWHGIMLFKSFAACAAPSWLGWPMFTIWVPIVQCPMLWVIDQHRSFKNKSAGWSGGIALCHLGALVWSPACDVPMSSVFPGQ